MDLGGHKGQAKIAGDIETNLVVIHYHFKSFDEYVKQTKKVLLSHGYIKEEDNDNVALKKLKEHRGSVSHHRKDFYINYLKSGKEKFGVFCDKHQGTQEIDLIKETLIGQNRPLVNPIISKMIEIYGQEGFEFVFEDQSRGLLMRHPSDPVTDLLNDPMVKNLEFLPWGMACSTNDIELFHRMTRNVDARNIFIVGNAWGFSAMCFAAMCPLANIDVIDAEDACNPDVQPIFGPRLKEFTAMARKVAGKHCPGRVNITTGYSPQDTLNAIREGVKYDVVFIDGEHTNDAMKADYYGIKNYLSEKCIIFFHDIRIGNLHSGMKDIIENAKKDGFDYFQVDVPESSFGMGVIARGISPL